MNSLEYANELFQQAAGILGVKYTKTTASKLQLWATENQPPFIGLVSMIETGNTTVSSNLLTFSCVGVFIVASNMDPSDDEVYENHALSSSLTKKFKQLVRTNRYCDIQTMTIEEVFRFDTYAGIGHIATFELTMPDLTDYCGVDCSLKDLNNCE